MAQKVTAQFYETDDGSDDPRAIQGGGGASWHLIKVSHNSRWLIDAYVRAYHNRYGDALVVRIFKGV